jgi:hypothetical protein
VNLKKLVIAASAFACATVLSFGWSEQGGVSLSINKAEAKARVYIRSGYAVNAVYVPMPGLAWYAVRAYYWGGPWSGPGYTATPAGMITRRAAALAAGPALWSKARTA